jgi:O-antigen ligase
MFHNIEVVLKGSVWGFLAGVMFYTLKEGFPFIYPKAFSYNAIAVMYLSGLFTTLRWGWYKRSLKLSTFVGIILLAHILATGSIKSNLGIVIGIICASLIYFRIFIRIFLRNTITLTVLASIIVYGVFSNDIFFEKIEGGMSRVMLGINVLNVRENSPSYIGTDKRMGWIEKGIEGWAQNPIFGHGVEAFRNDYGITSHSTPIDLLYNFGLIGFTLFYAIFISIAWRLFHARNRKLAGLHAIILGGLVCYLFITLPGTMHYSIFLAVFIAISSAILSYHRQQNINIEVSAGSDN